MARIIDVKANDDYTLDIQLENTHRIIYDMKTRLNSIRFKDLESLALFKKVRIENGNTLVWNPFCEITINELMTSIYKESNNGNQPVK